MKAIVLAAVVLLVTQCAVGMAEDQRHPKFYLAAEDSNADGDLMRLFKRFDAAKWVSILLRNNCMIY